MGIFKKLLAIVCNICPLCWFARKYPGNWFGKFMLWHGKWCPAWKSWEEFYGKERAKLIRKGGERAKEFSWDKTAKETIDLYHQVIGG